MDSITQRLSVSELTPRILEMAKSGVYRTSIFEAFRAMATQKQISQAIRHAKQFGLYSVAGLRDAELGTYYQLDEVKYRSLQPTLQSTLINLDVDPVKQATEAMLTVKLMLAIAKGLTIALAGLSVFCFFTGHWQMAWETVAGTLSALGIWSVQKALAKKLN